MEIFLTPLFALRVFQAIAGYRMAGSKTLPGTSLGALPIARMVFLTRWSIPRSIERCTEEVCASSGLQAGCEMARFGCAEWPGPGGTSSISPA